MLADHLVRETGKNLSQINELSANNRPLVLFGAGATGASILTNCRAKNIEVACFCDNNAEKHGKKHAGLDVINYEQLIQRYPDCNLVLTIGTADREDVEKKLRADGFNHIYPFDLLLFDFVPGNSFILDNLNRFDRLYNMLADDESKQVLLARLNYLIGGDTSCMTSVQSGCEEYFDDHILQFKRDEYFIDAGALDGQTAIGFSKHVPDYSKIVCFEPDQENYLKTIGSTKSLKNIKIQLHGLWSERATIRFHSNGGGSCINEEGEQAIEVTTLDDECEDKPVSFIKMDIEGAEMQALLGAKRLIREKEPKLAVCVYHRQEDILSIPFLLHEMKPEYKLYFRHYSSTLLDTVCYATK